MHIRVTAIQFQCFNIILEISKENEEEIKKYCADAGVDVVKIKATQYGLKL